MNRMALLLTTAALVIGCENATTPTPDPRAVQGTAGLITNPTYIGDATAVKATVLGLSATVVHAGPLAPTGGTQVVTLATANVLNVATADLLRASVDGRFSRSLSKASLTNLAITVGGNVITATAVAASALAPCGTPRTATTVTGLVVNGVPITVTGAPNQTVPLLVGSLIINEQFSIFNGHGITVNGLHVLIPGVADIIVSQATAAIRC